MPIICWGNLAKSADETTRIEQSISAYVEGHDENPNAHMGTDYSLGAHRLAVELDHLDESVLAKHLSKDITWVGQAQNSNDQTLVGDNEFQTVEDLSVEFASAQDGKMLMLAVIHASASSSEATPVIRFKVTRNGVDSYYPSTAGDEMPFIPSVVSTQTFLCTFSWIASLPIGSVIVTVEAARSSPDAVVKILGLQNYQVSRLIVLTIGSEITV